MDINWSDYAIPIIALVGTMFGGAGLEFIKRWLGKAKERDDTATALRNELRGELTSIKQELAAVEKELDEWKTKYYDVVEKYLTVKIQYENLMRQMQSNQTEVKQPDTIEVIDTKQEPGV